MESGRAAYDDTDEAPRLEIADMSWLECQKYFLGISPGFADKLEEISRMSWL
jgi:hypothetical protein